ncbi:hypothetical protein B484DRAFT_460319 [Ochromonadaceae sp. CCMP2298]|nr:hypothetical protein B484DRAFT_460319 [Ochromonadaceae sp. CCMP2298]
MHLTSSAVPPTIPEACHSTSACRPTLSRRAIVWGNTGALVWSSLPTPDTSESPRIRRRMRLRPCGSLPLDRAGLRASLSLSLCSFSLCSFSFSLSLSHSFNFDLRSNFSLVSFSTPRTLLMPLLTSSERSSEPLLTSSAIRSILPISSSFALSSSSLALRILSPNACRRLLDSSFTVRILSAHCSTPEEGPSEGGSLTLLLYRSRIFLPWYTPTATVKPTSGSTTLLTF